MKKILLILLLLSVVVFSSNAQLTKVGSALSYNTGHFFNDEYLRNHKTGNPVLSLTSIYEINLAFHLKPSLNIFFPRINKEEPFPDYFSKTIATAYALDMDIHYVFNYLDRFELYALAGLNILYARMKWKDESIDGNFTSSSGETSMGFNLGIGTYIKLKDQFDLFFEIKGIVASQSMLVATGGILLDIDYLKRTKESEF